MKKKSLLIVEDSKTARVQLSEVLGKSGYNVQTAENGKDALEKFEEYHYPIVITDLEMPVMSGYELIDKINEMKEPPLIIVITNNDKFETIIDIMKKGVFDYTIKPLTSNDLLIKVDRAFLAYERNKIYRIKEKEETVGTIFRNLQRSFNQGAGIGTHMTLVQMIIDNSEEKDEKYCIDKIIFEQIKENQKMVRKALNGLSEMERLMFQDIELELTDCGDIGEMLKELKSELKDKEDIAEQNIIINGIVPDFCSYPIDMNKSYLKKALSEILINAMKFSEEKTDIVVDISVEDYSILINVTNSPITYKGAKGIPLEFEESIFEPFFRIENFINEKYETTELGLGLLVVKKILNEHEGDIEISNVNSGNGDVKVKCVISLPIYKQVDEEKTF